MKFGSLFVGIGGIDLGLERAGMECIWQVENDSYAIKVLEKHWPNIKRYRDVKEVHGIMAHSNSGRSFSTIRETLSEREEKKTSNTKSCGGSQDGGNLLGTNIEKGCLNCLETVDLIAGGFPCQPHSVAGKRRGAEDDRNLWPEFSRIVAELRPRYILAENVPGIVTSYLDEVLSDLESQGYTCGTFDIPACAFDAPHRRQRIFVIGWNSNGGNGDEGSIDKVAEGQDPESAGVCESLSDPKITDDGSGSPEQMRGQAQQFRVGTVEGNVADTGGNRMALNGESGEDQRERRDRGGVPQNDSGQFWAVEPNVGRVAHGVSKRVDRLKCLGNAVLPQVAEFIGNCIMEFDKTNPPPLKWG